MTLHQKITKNLEFSNSAESMSISKMLKSIQTSIFMSGAKVKIKVYKNVYNNVDAKIDTSVVTFTFSVAATALFEIKSMSSFCWRT